MAESTDKQLNKNGDKRGMSHNSLKNLRPNRNGRLPAKLSLTSLTKRELARIPTIKEDGFDGKGKPNAWWIARNAVRDARNGDRSARTEVWERLEGKVTQPVQAQVEGEIRGTFNFILPDGSKFKPGELIKADGNSD